MRIFFFAAMAGLHFTAMAQSSKDTLCIIGVGDIMLGTSYPTGFLPPHDGKNILSPVAGILQRADLTFGNYEGTLFNGEGRVKKCADSTRCFAFKTPEHYAYYLKNAGFDLMSVANNHSGDFGPEARERTMQVLQSVGIASSGTLEKPFVVVEKRGVRYGLASFAPNAGTQSINHLKAAQKIISYLDSLCDVVLVSFHGGAEGTARQHVPYQDEIFMGENRGDVYRFSRMAIDAGADVVFGHGPHVTRAVDLYRGRFISYSLGNFATYGRFSLKGAAGIAPIMKVYVDRKGAFLKGEIVPVKQTGEGGPQVDPYGAVIQKLQQLTAQDFPSTPLVINHKGIIRKKRNNQQTKLARNDERKNGNRYYRMGTK